MNEQIKTLGENIKEIQGMWASDTIDLQQRDKLINWLIEELTKNRDY